MGILLTEISIASSSLSYAKEKVLFSNKAKEMEALFSPKRRLGLVLTFYKKDGMALYPFKNELFSLLIHYFPPIVLPFVK